MARDDILKAAAAGLQPKSLDLTTLAKARVASRVRPTLKVSNADAGFALGFAAGPITTKQGETHQGDELAVVLLRLKYAAQFNLAGFERALYLLLHRHGGLSGKASETMRACAAAAILEWVHDACPKCRPLRAPGAFATPAKGMVCVSCRNSGRKAQKSKDRWRAVSDLLVQVQRDRGFDVVGMPYKLFIAHWHVRVERFLGALRATDRSMATTIDFGIAANDRSAMGIDGDETMPEDTRDGVGPQEQIQSI